MGYKLEIKHYGVRQGLGVLVKLLEEGDEYETVIFVGILDFGSKQKFIPEQWLNEIVNTINDNGGILEYILISHQDDDHYNLISTIGEKYHTLYREKITVEKIVVGGGRNSTLINNVFSEFSHQAAIFLSTPYRIVENLYQDNQTTWDIWLPLANGGVFCSQIIVANQGVRKNTQSCIALLSLIDSTNRPVYSYLFTGDATFTTFNYISAFTFSQELKLMLIPHHGSLNTTKGSNFNELDQLFLKYEPHRAVVSGDPSYKWKHPHKDVIEQFISRVGNGEDRIITYAADDKIYSENSSKRIRVTRTTPTENDGKARYDETVIYKNESPFYTFRI